MVWGRFRRPVFELPSVLDATGLLDKEIQRDVQVLESLASQESSINGMKLSRFDRVLGLNRERIERVFRA